LTKEPVADSLQSILIGASREDVLGPGTVTKEEREIVEKADSKSDFAAKPRLNI